MNPGRIATFYSYKGGTGRSMAMANFAWILAASGKRVLAIDWDLEAPGLHRYFRPFLADPDLFETDGLIDMFWNLTVSAARDGVSKSYHAETATGFVKTANTLLPNQNGEQVIEALEDATRRLDSTFFPPDGCLDFIGAGRQSSTYSERVNSFDWKRFYDLGGVQMLDTAKQYLREHYDWVLIDSRTGVSDTSGICTIQMPQTVVAFFTLNRQSIEGVAAILKSIRDYRSASIDGSKIEFFPVATRIENAEKRKLELARRYARRILADYLPQTVQANKRDYWDKMEIAYRPAYAFEEILAAFGDATDEAGSADTMLTQVELTSQQITGDDKLRMSEIGERQREDVLTKYALGTLSPAAAEEAADTDFLRDIRSKEQLWRSSGFRWRLLLSRRELDLLTEDDRKGFGRNMQYYLIQSERMHKLLRIGQIMGSSVFIFVLVASVLFLLLTRGWYYPWYRPVEGVVYLLWSLLIAWILSFAVRVVVGAVRDKPEGVGLLQMLSISKFGPVGIRVPDYTPKEKPKS